MPPLRLGVILRLLLLTAFALVLVPPTHAEEQAGRNPGDRFEVEGYFGFYSNLAFPATRRENPRYTQFLQRFDPRFVSLLRPDLPSRDVRWEGGFRASYDVRARWALEYSFSYTQGSNFKFRDSYLQLVVPATLAVFPNLSVARLLPARGRLWIHSLNVVLHAREEGRWVPYFTGGVSAMTFGKGPTADYRFFVGVDFLGEKIVDSYTFTYNNSFTRIAGNAGGGLKLYLTPHLGIRTDARFLFSRPRFTQTGSVIMPLFIPPIGPDRDGRRFRPGTTAEQQGLYSNFNFTVGVFTRF